jgi:hypothetical protein
MKAVLVGRIPAGNLFYLLEGDTDAAIVTPKRDVKPVSFLSIVAKKQVRRMMDSKFHEFLWEGVDKPNDRWENIVVYKVQQVPEHMLAGVEILSSLDKKKKDARYEVLEQKIDLIDNFKVAIESGQHEKALGRRIRSFRFDPDAEDGDGDGIVQEGTPFARPATPDLKPKRRENRVQRRANQMQESSDASADGLTSRRNYLPSRDVMKRLVTRDAAHYKKVYEDQSKKVEAAFSDGKKLKTYGDVVKAMEKAHPGFASGSSMADYLEIGRLRPDMELERQHREHAYAVMFAILANPRLKEADLRIISAKNRARLGEPVANAEGSCCFRPRGKIALNSGDPIDRFSLKPQKDDRKPRLDLMYQDENSADAVTSIAQLRGLQTTGSIVMASMLQDASGPEVWEAMRDVVHRQVTLHEMAHASNDIQAYLDGVKSKGFEEGNVRKIIQEGIIQPLADMGDEEIIATAVRQYLADRSTTLSFTVNNVMAQLNEAMSNPNLKNRAEKLTREPLLDADGNEMPIGESMAEFFRSVGFSEDIANPDQPWTAGLLVSMHAMDGQWGRPLWTDRRDGYYRRSTWARNTAATKVTTPNGTTLTQFDLEKIHELGIPATSATPEVSLEDTRTFINALLTLDNISDEMFSPTTGLEPYELWDLGSNGETQLRDMLGNSVLARFEAVEYAKTSMNQYLESAFNPNAPKATQERTAAYVFEMALMGPHMFDDLTPRERAIAKKIAKLNGGGEYVSYMGALTFGRSFQGIFSDWQSAELVAEVSTHAMLGAEIKIPDGEGMRVLNDVEKRVLNKLLAWLWPEGDVRL